MASSATMPVCSRPLSACEPIHPSSGGRQRPSPRARTAPAALRARPALVWRPSAAISKGSHRTSRPASPSGPRLAALSGHLCGLAPCQPPCEPVRPLPGGPQWPSLRARAAPFALRARPLLVWRPSVAISAGSRLPSGLRARPPRVWRPSAAISAGSPVPAALRARPPLVWRPSAAISAGSRRTSRPASPSAPRLAAVSGHLRGLAPSHPPCEPVRPSSGGPQWPSPRARTVPSGLRAHPPLVWRPSAAISAGSRRAIPPCHSICETINAKVFCSPEAIKRIMCIYILCFCPSDMSANTKRRVHKH